MHGRFELRSKDDEIESNKQFDTHRKAILDEAAINCIIADSRPFGDFHKIGMTEFTLFFNFDFN